MFSSELGASHSVLKSHPDKIMSGGYVGNTDTHRSPQNTQFLASLYSSRSADGDTR